ncbi:MULTISPECIES: AEC family transporter [Hydrogenophaga]|uniref:Transporter n=1 Tax=Hydrogenophaga electricum TaxID=1230953 RepID=A0ABQ6C084_9BURK|nr:MULTISPECIES: AEC family transporter [Hydrogenophaga]GLS13798.1 transporter [Hydrogenophaga electricum]
MLDILAITGPIYLCILAGYATTRAGLFAPADMRVFGKFVINLALPALLFNALSQRTVAEIFNGPYLLAYTLANLAVLTIGFVWMRFGQRSSMSLAGTVAMGMTCPNSGFVGYPVALLTLGASTAGVSLALNMVVENLLIIPLLLALTDLDGDGQGDWRRSVAQALKGVLRNPMIIAIVAGTLVSLAGLALPSALSRTVTLFAQASGALSLFVIGGSLVGLKAPSGTGGQIVGIALGKLVLHPLLMLGLLWWVVPVADPALRQALVLTCALPMFGIYAILAQRHGHAGLASAALLVTTLAAFFSLSGLLWLLQHGSGWLG